MYFWLKVLCEHIIQYNKSDLCSFHIVQDIEVQKYDLIKNAITIYPFSFRSSDGGAMQKTN